MPSPKRPATGKNQTVPAGERIAKRLSRAGIASRRQAEDMIRAGRVTINGNRIDSPALNVTVSDRIAVDGHPLAEPERMRLWLYHKPTGLVTTARDEKGRQTVFDTLPDTLPRVMPVGRLDLTSEGLLLLTNDGELKRRLELPATGWLRKYRVRVHGRPDDDMLAPLREGVTIDGDRFQPMQVAIDRQQGANAWLTIGIREGRNREIRRALESVGLPVSRLIRTGYGPFRLGDLAKGAVREVKERILREQLGLEAGAAAEANTSQAKGRPHGNPPSARKPRPEAKPGPTAKRAPGKSARHASKKKITAGTNPGKRGPAGTGSTRH